MSQSSNRTLVELKASKRSAAETIGKSSNRTLVELKENAVNKLIAERLFQSYLSGIERKFFTEIVVSGFAFQSYLSGIESRFRYYRRSG